MPAFLASGVQEVAEAMATTFEREDLAGSQLRWCPERDAIALRRWITDRSRELGGGVRRAVRFARLAAIAAGGDYIRFLYDGRIPALRARHFRTTLEAVQASGQLPQAQVTLSRSGVMLHEPSMRVADKAGGAGFDVDFSQMPRLAALLDILHNALGFAVIADLLQPILGSAAPRTHADDVARALHAAVNAWLGERLDSPHYIRQAQAMRAFLAQRGPLGPEAVDDEAILSFWMSVAPAGQAAEVEGFRLFTSAARGMLCYRRCLRDRAVYDAIGAPLSLEDNLDRPVAVSVPVESSGFADPWQSPLCGLASVPASNIKWLTKRERLRLLNYLGGPHPDEDGEEAEAIDRDAGDRGLAGGERYDLRFLRTLLRADVFGAAQAGIVARLRKRAPPLSAVDEEMYAATDDAYGGCVASYHAVREQLRLEALAALDVLLEHGTTEALTLLDHLAGRDVVGRLLALAGVGGATVEALGAFEPEVEIGAIPPYQSELDDRQRQAIASALRSVARGEAHDRALSDLMVQAHRAARAVNRIGFRREDRAAPATLTALQASVPAVTSVLAELDRLLLAFPQAAGPEAMITDRLHFDIAFRSIYGPSPA